MGATEGREKEGKPVGTSVVGVTEGEKLLSGEIVGSTGEGD